MNPLYESSSSEQDQNFYSQTFSEDKQETEDLTCSQMFAKFNA